MALPAPLSHIRPESQGRHLLLTATRYWDDVLALFILTPVLLSLCSYFLLPKKHEPGYGLLFVSPQRQHGLITEKGKIGKGARDINRKFNEAVSFAVHWLV